MSLRDEPGAECIDEGALAHPGHAGDPDAPRPSGCRHELVEQSGRLRLVLRLAGLDQGDGSAQRSTVSVPDALGEVVDAGGAHGTSSSRKSSRAAVVMTVPGPKMATAPAS